MKPPLIHLLLAETNHFSNYTCPAYANPTAASASWSCTKCLKASCGFCSNASGKLNPGTCLIVDDDNKAKEGGSGTQGLNSKLHLTFHDVQLKILKDLEEEIVNHEV